LRQFPLQRTLEYEMGIGHRKRCRNHL
jgi:hypothetical protein